MFWTVWISSPASEEGMFDCFFQMWVIERFFNQVTLFWGRTGRIAQLDDLCYCSLGICVDYLVGGGDVI